MGCCDTGWLGSGGARGDLDGKPARCQPGHHRDAVRIAVDGAPGPEDDRRALGHGSRPAGASARLLGLEGEKELIGRGLSTCATCDGYFFRGKPIAVVGGGDSAMEEANFLSRYASRVYLIHRRDEFRASKIMIDRARANEKVEFVTPYVVDEILSPEKVVTGIRLKHAKTGEKREIELHGIFVAIGHNPNSTAFRGKLETDQTATSSPATAA